MSSAIASRVRSSWVGPRPPQIEHRVGTREQVAQRGDDARLVVADRAVLVRVDARRRELLADPRTVRVDDLPEQQLGPDRENLTPHLVTFPGMPRQVDLLRILRCQSM